MSFAVACAVLTPLMAVVRAGGGDPAVPRVLPRTLYGVTVDDVSRLGEIVSASRHLPAMPVTRVYFDVTTRTGSQARPPRAGGTRRGAPGRPGRSRPRCPVPLARPAVS